MMAEFNILHTSEIQTSLPVQNYHLLDNYNAIKASTDTKLNKDSSSLQTVAGTVSFNQLETGTFSGNPNFTGTPTFPTLGLGVETIATATADCNLITRSGNYRTNASTLNVPIATRFYSLVHQAGGDVNTVATQVAIDVNNSGEMYIRQRTTIGGWGAWRAISTRAYALGDSIRGNAPTWTSNTSITMPAGLECADSLRSTLIRVAGSTVINFATTGLNALDTGTIASNTWYYIHAIFNPTTGATGYVASTSSTSPTMPSGFTIRRLLPLILRTNASTQIIPFVLNEWGYENTELQYVANSSGVSFNGPHQVFNGVGATFPNPAGVFSVASFCPPEALTVILGTFVRTITSAFTLARIFDGSGGDDAHIRVSGFAGTGFIKGFDVRLFKQIRAFREDNTGTLVVDVLGFTVGRIG